MGARERGATGRMRGSGGGRLDETVTLPAGTFVTGYDTHGHRFSRYFHHDTVFPADCVGDGGVLLGGWESEWASADAIGWAENGDE